MSSSIVGRTLKEVRIHLCPKAPTSNSTRQFIDKHYLGIKQRNPDLPILIRECSGIEPKAWFRFDFGKETSEPLKDLNADQIAGLFKDRVASSN